VGLVLNVSLGITAAHLYSLDDHKMGAAGSVPQVDEDRKIMLQDLRRLARSLLNGREGVMQYPKRELFEMAQKQCSLGVEEAELLNGLDGDIDLYSFCRRLDSLIQRMEFFEKSGSQGADPLEEENFRMEWFSMVSDFEGAAPSL